MIYIISAHLDGSTSDIIEWLFKFKKKFLRINDIIVLKKITGLFPIKFSNHSINLTRVKEQAELPTIWFRKLSGYGYISNQYIQDYYKNESENLLEFLLKSKECFKKIIGMPVTGTSINKLEILSIAQKYGLLIPATIITNSKRDLKSFYKEYGKIIIKPISEAFTGEINGKFMFSYTKLVKRKIIDSLPKTFSTSLFQQCIEKEFDIRIFYLDGNLYPMAVFSQSSHKTEIDFRRYNFLNPNRYVPYKLPKDMEEKLLLFMKEYKFEASSVDMVKCKNTGKYYFLEVNPYGEFRMVSSPCNYYLEKKIAELL